jgi:tetratricopeptide (TPR) repeat protein
MLLRSSRALHRGVALTLALLVALPAAAEPALEAPAPASPSSEPPAPAGEEAATAPARTPSSPAHELFLEAESRYDAGDYAGALQLLRESYELATPELRIGLLFSLAQAYRQLDRCEEARDHYAEYLTSSRAKSAAVAQRRDDARYYWQKMNAECPVSAGTPNGASPSVSSLAPVPALAPRAEPVPASAPDHSGPSTNQIVAWSLFGVGGAAAAGSVIFALASSRAESDVEHLARAGVSYDAVVRPREEDGRLYEKYALIFVGSAVFCGGVGAALLLLEEPREAPAPALGFNIDPSGGSFRLDYQGSF